MLTKWLARHTLCRWRGHFWSRARRVSPSAGAETCKVCGATQMVTLRAKRELPKQAPESASAIRT